MPDINEVCAVLAVVVDYAPIFFATIDGAFCNAHATEFTNTVGTQCVVPATDAKVKTARDNTTK